MRQHYPVRAAISLYCALTTACSSSWRLLSADPAKPISSGAPVQVWSHDTLWTLRHALVTADSVSGTFFDSVSRHDSRLSIPRARVDSIRIRHRSKAPIIVAFVVGTALLVGILTICGDETVGGCSHAD